MVLGFKDLNRSLENLVGAAAATSSFVHHRGLSRWDVQVHLTKCQRGSVVPSELGCVVDDQS